MLCGVASQLTQHTKYVFLNILILHLTLRDHFNSDIVLQTLFAEAGVSFKLEFPIEAMPAICVI